MFVAFYMNNKEMTRKIVLSMCLWKGNIIIWTCLLKWLHAGVCSKVTIQTNHVIKALKTGFEEGILTTKLNQH